MDDARRWLARDRFRLALLVALLLVGVLAVAAPLLPLPDPVEVRMERALEPPNGHAWLGTDQFGRDLLSRLIFGARVSLGTAGAVLALVMTVSLTLGLAAGLLGGLADDVIMRVVDMLLALPALIVAVAIVGVMGPSLANLMLAIVATSWATHARMIRGMVLQAREQEYVAAAVAVGAGRLRIARRHLLPAIAGQVLVLASLDLGFIILTISGLSFLGLGAQPPAPEWGAMLNEGRPFFQTAPQLMLYPGLAISLTVLGFNLLGDGLRDALDPQAVVRGAQVGAHDATGASTGRSGVGAARGTREQRERRGVPRPQASSPPPAGRR
jgi:peptide/nickel transport system permease protein